jgi:hypothetical protein
MMPATSSQVIRTRLTTAATGASLSQSITSASNRTVKRELPPAHGTCIVKTPCIGQLVLGTSATSRVSS